MKVALKCWRTCHSNFTWIPSSRNKGALFLGEQMRVLSQQRVLWRRPHSAQLTSTLTLSGPSPPSRYRLYLSFLWRAHSILSDPLLLSSARRLLSKVCHQSWCLLEGERENWVCNPGLPATLATSRAHTAHVDEPLLGPGDCGQRGHSCHGTGADLQLLPGSHHVPPQIIQ